MAVARSQNSTVATTTGATTLTINFSANPVAGGKVLSWAAGYGMTSITATDNGATPTTLTQDVSNVAVNVKSYLFRGDAVTPPGSGTYAVTYTIVGNTFLTAGATVYTGAAAGAPTASNNNSSSTATGSVTTLAASNPGAGALYYGTFASNNGSALTSISLTSAGWTATQQNLTQIGGAAADLVSGTGSQTATWTQAGTNIFAACIATYAAAAGPATAGTTVGQTYRSPSRRSIYRRPRLRPYRNSPGWQNHSRVVIGATPAAAPGNVTGDTARSSTFGMAVAATVTPAGGATYRMYDTASPSTAGNLDSAVDLGVEFYVTSAATLTEIRWFQPSTNSNTAVRQAAIYRVSDQAQVATATSAAPTGTGWQTLTIPGGYTLTPNTRYRAVVYCPSGGYAQDSFYFGGASDQVNGPLIFPNLTNATSQQQGQFVYAAGLAYPTGTFNQSNYWIDVTVSTVSGTANTGDATLPETFGLASAATRGTSGDTALPETFGLNSATTRGTSGDTTLPETFGLASAATRGVPGDGSVPGAFGLSSTASKGTVANTTIPTTFGLSSAATRSTAGDAAISETFGLASTATRGVSTGSSIPATFGLQTDATRAATGSASVPSTFGLASTATRGTYGDVGVAEVFGLASTATRGVTTGSTLATTFGLAVTASTGTAADITLPTAFGLATSATKGLSCGASIGGTFGLLVDAQIGSGVVINLPVSFGLQAAATRATTAAAQLPTGFGLNTTTTRGTTAGAAIAAVLGLASTTVRGTFANASIQATAGITTGVAKGVNADVTLATTWSLPISTGASSAYAADVSLTTRLGLASTATKGLNTGAALPVGFGLLPATTRGVNAALTLEQVFALSSRAAMDTTVPGSVASSLSLVVDTSVGRTTGALLAPTLALTIEAVIGLQPVLAGARGLPQPGMSARGAVGPSIQVAGVAVDPAPSVAAVPQAGIRARLVEFGDPPLHVGGS